MKKMLLIFAVACAPLVAQEGFDFKTLDKLGLNATNKTSITLDGDMLKLASGFLGNDKDSDSLKPLVDSLKGIYIRSFEFDKDGQYSERHLDGLRTYLKQGNWNRIVESRDAKAFSEIYLQPLDNSRLGGVAIISAEPREVTVVFISGNLKQEDIAKLSGNMGIPDLKMDLLNRKAPEKAAKTKKQDEE